MLCGYEVPLGPRRRRIQCTAEFFSGDALLLDAVWGTPFLFLRREPALRFDGALAAAEDFYFAQDCLHRHALKSVPCVPAPLVIVHLQADARVNAWHDAHWGPVRRGLARFGGRYLIRGSLPTVAEGKQFFTRLTVLEFPSIEAIQRS